MAAIATLALGGLDIMLPDMGTPPKMYGQYLQRIGKQKWNKKTK